jgi:hypothetical protein
MEPDGQASGRFLKDGANQRIDVIAATVAGIRSALVDAMMLSICVALDAVSYSVRPTLFFQELQAGIIVRELSVQVGYGVLLKAFNGIATAFHDADSLPFVLLVVKG